MFERHPDIVKRLCQDAPALLPTLFDGLIWRSRTAENGMRRVNYYVKHLMVDASGGFSKVTDIVWGRIAFRTFLYGKSWLLFTLLIFVIGTAGLKHLDTGHDSDAERMSVFACRIFIYVFSMGSWIFFHVKHLCKDIHNRDFVRFLHF